MRVTAIGAALIVLVFSGLGTQARAQSISQRVAQEYARQNNFPVKLVAAGADRRRVTRMFVPVTEQTYSSFLERFCQANGYCHLNFNSANNHLAMGLRAPAGGQPSDCYLWARNYNGSVQDIDDYRNTYMSFNQGGYIIPVNLQGAKVQHLSQWLTDRANPQDSLYRQGNCMEWLPNAEVGPNTSLFHDMGLRRSRDGRNMKAKILHAANGNVDVVGVFVPDIQHFNQLNEQQLLGPPPAGGVPDATR